MLEREEYLTFLQKYNYDCGAGAAAIVLRNFGLRVNYPNLMTALNVRRNGTWPNKLEEYFRKRGFNVYSQENSSIAQLKRETDNGKLSIVLYQGSGTRREMNRYEAGHYSVVAGVTSRYVYLLDPGVDKDYGHGVGWQIIDVNNFRNRWVDRWKERGEYVYAYSWMLPVGKPRNFGK